MKPEEKARKLIDAQLIKEGWQVVNRDEVVPRQLALAVREELLCGNQRADYVLLLGGKACAIIEAKRPDVQLTSPEVKAQAERYARLLNPSFPCVGPQVPLIFLANGVQIWGRDLDNQDSDLYLAQSRFPRPWELWARFPQLQQDLPGARLNSFALLPPLSEQELSSLRPCQAEAITNYELSLQSGAQRAYMELATGVGKTHTACTEVYRLLRYVGIKRVLYLTDRVNLCTAALRSFAAFKVEDQLPFGQRYGLAQLTSAEQLTQSNTSVFFSTIQRLSSIMAGQALNSETECGADVLDDASSSNEQEVALPSCPKIPADCFDLIIIDECHRSIYKRWRPWLEYLGQHALLLGLTATPIAETDHFFGGNKVSSYDLRRSIEDGVNVNILVYRIMTERTVYGGAISAGESVQVTSNLTGQTKNKVAQVEQAYGQHELNSRFLLPEQIKAVLACYRDVVFTKLYPQRAPQDPADFAYLPKTLIFAANERQAQLIVDQARVVFGVTANDPFVQRITYTVPNAEGLIHDFRYRKDFRIAVTVNLLATGTDLPCLEVMIFMSDIKSEVLYQQMKGRGVRTIPDDFLREVTPNAQHKDFCVLIDAVGVTQSEKTMPCLNPEFQPQLSLERLLELLARGVVSDNNILLLADRLINIALRGDKGELSELHQLSPHFDLRDFAHQLVGALESGALPPYLDSNELNWERTNLLALLLDDLSLRRKLLEINRGYVKVLPQQQDRILFAGFAHDEAGQQVQHFEAVLSDLAQDHEIFMRLKHQESVPLELLTPECLSSMEELMGRYLPNFSVARMWGAYLMTEHHGAVRQVIPLAEAEVGAQTNCLQLVRFALHQGNELFSLGHEPHCSQRFEQWWRHEAAAFGLEEQARAPCQLVAQHIIGSGALLSLRAVRRVDQDLYIALRKVVAQAHTECALKSLSQVMLASA